MDFHAGAYVEMYGGITGYIQDIRTVDLGDMLITITCLKPKSLEGQSVVIRKFVGKPLDTYFTQIGRQRYEEGTVEPVKLDSYSTFASWSAVQGKINELVAAVNKINKQLKER